MPFTLDIDTFRIDVQTVFNKFPTESYTYEHPSGTQVRDFQVKWGKYSYTISYGINFGNNNLIGFNFKYGDEHITLGNYDVQTKKFGAYDFCENSIRLVTHIKSRELHETLVSIVEKNFQDGHDHFSKHLTEEPWSPTIHVNKEDITASMQDNFRQYFSTKWDINLQKILSITTISHTIKTKISYNMIGTKLAELFFNIEYTDESLKYTKCLYTGSYFVDRQKFALDDGDKPDGFDEGFAMFSLIQNLTK